MNEYKFGGSTVSIKIAASRAAAILTLAALLLSPTAAFASYLPGQTLNPSCTPTDPTCVVVANTAGTFVATTTNATSTFAGNVSVSGNVAIGSLNGILKAVSGVITTAFVNLSSDVTGILGITNGGTGLAASPTYGQVLVGNSSGGYSLMATSSLGVGGNSQWTTSSANIFYTTGNVGIGTTSPGSALSVGGNGYVSGSLAVTGTTTSITALVAGSNTIASKGGFFSTANLNMNSYSGPTATNNVFGWNGNATGTCSTECSMLDFIANSDNIAAGTHLVNVARFYQNFGGPSSSGGFTGTDVTINQTAATNNINDTGYYVAQQSTAQATANDTGTSGAYSGHLYGLSTNVRLTGTASYWDQLVGQENDIAAYAGSTVNDKIGLQIVEQGLDAVSANRTNAAISINNDPAATGWKLGLAFGAYSGSNPINAAGTLIGTYAHGVASPGIGAMGTVANGIDFSQYTFTGDFLKSLGFTVDGNGNASSSAISAKQAWFGNTGTSSFASNGSLTTVGTLSAGEDASDNGIEIVPGSTSGNNPAYIAPLLSGGQSNIALQLRSSGSGLIQLMNSSSSNLFTAVQDGTPNSNTDYMTLHATAAGANAIYTTTAGSDSRVDWRLITKGAGSKFNFGAGGDSPNNGNSDFEIDGGSTATSWLTVNGSVSSAPTLGCNGTNCSIVLSPNGTGNVGIGTTTPGSLFSIGNTSGINFSIATSSFSTTGGINLAAGCYAINGTCLSLSNFGGTLSVANGGTGSTTLTGILKGNGTGSIVSALAGTDFQAPIVAGTGLSFSGNTLNDYWTLNGSNNLYNNNAGLEIGINNNSPSYTLDVGGYINTGANYGFKQAGNTILIASSTNFTTFVGQSAGAGILAIATSSSNTSGVGDTVMGYQAMQFSTSSQSVAVGYQALEGNSTTGTSGSGENTAIGYKALTANLKGFKNTAIGWGALAANTNSNESVAIGDNALASLSDNGSGEGLEVAIGYNAGEFSNAAYDVFVGDGAGLKQANGIADTVVGYEAGSGLTSAVGTASYNGGTYLGYEAGGDDVSGAAYNTEVGYQAGLGTNSTSQTGYDNTYLGSLAGENILSGANNIAIGYNALLPSTTASNQLNIGNFIFGSGLTATSSGTSIPATLTGNLGIGTTSPAARLTVWGTDTASTSAFAVVNSASTTVFSVFDNGNATYSGSIYQSSDQRLKTDILSLDASSSLADIEGLNPVSYTRLDQDTGTNLGFIAQQVQQIFPELVSTTSATALTPNGTLTLNYVGLIAPMVKAIQALGTEIASLEQTVAGFAESITTKVLTAATGHFSNQLCVGSTCVTPAQFQAMVAAANQSNNSSASVSAPSTDDTATTTPPVIQVNGDNPATINVGDTYADLGATITGPTADLNLGIQTFVGTTPMSQAVIDTSAPATYHIYYVVTDAEGNTSTSTRTVIVEASTIGTATSSTSTASTTSQTN